MPFQSVANDPMQPFTIAVTLDHPIADVWQAITRKKLVDGYYLAPLWADITSVGAEINYGPPGQPMILGRILALEEPRRLAHSFRFDGDDAPDTIVTYALAPRGTGTHLTIEHRGYPVVSQGYADISGGWPIIVERLKGLLDGRKNG